MALFNTDKNSENRLSPTVNSGDVHHNPKAHSTTSISLRSAGSVETGRVITKDDSIIVYDGSNFRVGIGRLPNGSYGVAVTKEGYDLSDAIS